MNKKIDNVRSGKLNTLSNEQKHFQKYFLYTIILHRNPFVKVFARIILIGGFYYGRKRKN